MERPPVNLPPPAYDGSNSLEKVICLRHSRRRFSCVQLPLKTIGQLLWAAGGAGYSEVTGANRTFPSAGATYATEIYMLCDDTDELEAGFYRYNYERHELQMRIQGDLRSTIAEAAYGQMFIADAPFSFILVAVPQRTIRRYRERGVRYIYMEIGCITENIYLQAEALELGTVCVGAFDDDRLREILNLNPEEEPEMIIPVGKY